MNRITIIILFTITTIFAQNYTFSYIPNDTAPAVAVFFNDSFSYAAQIPDSGNYKSGGIGEELVFLDHNFDGYTDFYFFDIGNLGHGVCAYYLYIYDPALEDFSRAEAHRDNARGLVKINQNEDGSFSQIYYFDYVGCYDTITHYPDTIIEHIHCLDTEADIK